MKITCIVRLLTVVTSLFIHSKTAVISQFENLALNKTAYQIGETNFGGVAANASRAVDGNQNPNFASGSCIDAGYYTNPWWAVNLGQNYTIVGVNVTNRGDCCAYRSNYFIVGLTNTQPTRGQAISLSSYTRCGQYPGQVGLGATVYVACALDLPQFTYVIIQTNSSITGEVVLNVCEVEVYGFACDVNCAVGCARNGEGKCDGLCKFGFTNTSNNSCLPCDRNCADGCTVKGPGRCDGVCQFGYRMNVNYMCHKCDVNCATGCKTAGESRCDGPCYGGFYLTQMKTCVLLVNLALKKTAYQISTLVSGGLTYTASLSVDGIKDTNLMRGSCSFTDGNAPNPWWAVDLGITFTIIGINVTSHGDLVDDAKLDYFIVGLTNNQPQPGQQVALYNYTLCGQYTGTVAPGTTVYQPCSLNLLTYRYVIIQTNSSLTRGQQVITICEIEVYGFGCDPKCLVGCDLYGMSTCSSNCTSGYGSTTNHTCQECDAHCSSVGCNIAGGGFCDGPCSYNYDLSADRTCKLSTADKTTLSGPDSQDKLNSLTAAVIALAVVAGVLLVTSVVTVTLAVLYKRQVRTVTNDANKNKRLEDHNYQELQIAQSQQSSSNSANGAVFYDHIR